MIDEKKIELDDETAGCCVLVIIMGVMGPVGFWLGRMVIGWFR
jgi:hypothetical protein